MATLALSISSHVHTLPRAVEGNGLTATGEIPEVPVFRTLDCRPDRAGGAATIGAATALEFATTSW
jgi:hypothetical protein